MRGYFEILNNFFDKVYVITLQRATDRQLHIQEELKGLNYQFFFGKDKNDFTIEELKNSGIYNEELAKKHHPYKKSLHSGQIGCAWSHAEVYKDIVRNNYKQVLILEDDIVINSRNFHLLPLVLKEIPADWELIYFGFAENEVPPPFKLLKKGHYHLLRLLNFNRYTHSSIINFYPRKITHHMYKAGYHNCSHAYAITQPAALKLLHLQQPISYIADNLLAYACTNHIIKGYIILPKLINQHYQVTNKAPISYLND